jgi:Cytochrome b5-like Heme/Steroid binding domain
MSKSFSKEDVASHSKTDSLWIIVDDDVYDMTKFQDEHPGGKKSMTVTEPVMIEIVALIEAQFSSASVARMLQSNSGSTTMKASSRSSSQSSRSVR